MLKNVRALCASIVLAFAMVVDAGTAFGGERVLLLRNNLGSESAFIDRFLADSFPESYKANEEFGSVWLTLDDLLVGRYDVHGDGQAELFVYIAHPAWCGTAGCDLYVFENKDGAWVKAIHDGPQAAREREEGKTVDYLFVWTDPETGYKTVYTSNAGFRWTGERYEHIDDARILELEAERFDFAGMDDHLDAPGRGSRGTSDFDPDAVRHETDWDEGALRHLAVLVGTYRRGALVNDRAIWSALGQIMDRRELAQVILVALRGGPIGYDRGYLVLEGSRLGTDFDDRGSPSFWTAMIVVDTRDGRVHAGIQRNRDKSIYSLAQNYAKLPPPLYEWLHNGERSDFLFGGEPPFNVSWARRPAR